MYLGGIAEEVREKAINCYNLGTINGSRSGGIIYINNSSNLIISNCFNVGTVKCSGYDGSMAGILTVNNGNVTINNNYSMTKGINGDTWKKSFGAIIAKNSGSIVFNRCYYVEDEQLKTAVGGKQDDDTVSKCTTKEEITITMLNANIQELEHEEEWKSWKESDEGYPILDI